jgi:hypothetical protein
MNLIPNFPAPAPLPEPSLLVRLFLEQSGWPAAIIAFLGLCVFLVMNSRGDGRALRVLGLWLLTAGAVWGLGRLVETTREEVALATRRLITSVARPDLTALGNTLTADASFTGKQMLPELDRAQILDRVQQAMTNQYPLDGWAVLEVQAHETAPGRAQSMVLVRVEAKAGGINFSWWLLDWRKEGGAWKISRIEPLAIQGYLTLSGAR